MAKMPSRFLGGLILLAACGSAWAAKVGGVAYLNIDSGGDTIIWTSKGNIKGAGLFHIAGGITIYDYAGDSLETQLTIGMKADSVSASNGTASFYRWPVELMQFYKSGSFRAGAGLTYHLNPEAECDLPPSCNDLIKFDNALGYVVQADYVVPAKQLLRELTIGVRATFIDYKVDDGAYYDKIDGNSIGLSLGMSF